MANEMLQRLTADMKSAMKSGEKDRLQVLRMLISGLKEEQHRKETDELDDAAEMQVLRRAVKTRRETIEQARENGRTEVAEAEAAEVAIIEEYLPTMLTGDELAAKVREVATEVGYAGPADTGKFMKAWMAKYQGQAEGRDVQAALKAL
ncbi:MAG: GatB/YqeY domain-containing protein [Planctomycetes bacterium]|nr:GatB/YqeY domain-containing protein [Planctomycetota bacterium]